jgi:hypothetical protein
MLKIGEKITIITNGGDSKYKVCKIPKQVKRNCCICDIPIENWECCIAFCTNRILPKDCYFKKCFCKTQVKMWKPGQLVTIVRRHFIFTFRIVHKSKINNSYYERAEKITTTNHLRRWSRNVNEKLPIDCVLQLINVRTRNNIPKEMMG